MDNKHKNNDTEQEVLQKLDELEFLEDLSSPKADKNAELKPKTSGQVESQFKQKNPLSLAFFGDALFSYSVRNLLFVNFDFKPNVLNKMASSVECAKKQAEFALKLLPELNDEERDIFMRARNAHPNNKAKNASFEEYHLATAFEAVYGFWALNLNKYRNRIMQVYKMIAEALK